MRTVDDSLAAAAAEAAGSATITVQVNGEAHTLSPPLDVALLLERLGHEPTSVAVAVNGEFVPRPQRASTRLQNGDHVSCFKPIVGG